MIFRKQAKVKLNYIDAVDVINAARSFKNEPDYIQFFKTKAKRYENGFAVFENVQKTEFLDALDSRYDHE